jgi:hypothetical protein
MRETANSCPAGAHGAEPAARRRHRHPVWLEMPLRRRCASQRIRFFADERHTAINYNNHPGALPRCKPPAAAGGVDVWHQLCVRLCAPPQSTPRRLLTFLAEVAPEVRLSPSCMACTTFVGGPLAVQLRSNCGPTSPNFARFSRSAAAGTGPTSPRRTPTGGPNRPKLDPNMPKL